MEYPIYEFKVDEHNNVDAVALVESPAIKSNWFAFKDQKNHFNFSVDAEKQIIVGAAMIPNLKMFRIHEELGEFNCFFSEATIETIAQSFFKNSFQKNANIEHDPTQKLLDVTYFMSWIKNDALGFNPMNDDLPNGTWYLGAKVDDAATWEKIKKGEIKGFSVEGSFDIHKGGEDKELESLLSELAKKINDFNS